MDDDPIILRTTSLMFRKLGVVDVLTANGGAEALEMVSESMPTPDIVLTDLSMPDVDGMAVLRGLVEQGFQGGVGLVSGTEDRVLDSARQLAEVRGLRVMGVVAKPVRPALLSDLIENYLAQPSRPALADVGEESGVDEIAFAVEHGHIVPYYQPIIRSRDGVKTIFGVEALARWQHPERGVIPPGLFIPLAEKSGLVRPMTLSVVEQTFSDLRHWKSLGLELTVSINIAVDSLDPDEDLFGKLCGFADQYGIDPKEVILELTERQVMTNVADALEVLMRLHIHGFQLALDDFGTGYSSMQQLQLIPFSELKMDRSFVHQADKKGSARAILDSSISLGKALSMSMVAEGVETSEDLDTVTTAGIELIQGYLFARPMPGEDFVRWALAFDGS